MIEVLVLLILSLAFAEEIPDYDRPYSPIFTDRPVYSWTDKIQMKILAPSWNTDRHLVDSIGDTDEHPIKISTREHSLEPYRFTETDTNSGVFTAEVILTGFLHDVDGDGDFDTTPRTAGRGPTDGFLEADRDSAVTISFEFADGVVVSESVPVRWNVGTIGFSEDRYLPGDSARVLVVDPDMNLNPEALDRVQVRVSSDSDVAGIEIDAIETGKASGMFAGSLSFTQHKSTSGTRVYAVPGDAVYARYDDRTLPGPHSTSDSLGVEAAARLDLPAPATAGRITNPEILFTDSSGNHLTTFSQSSPIQVVGTLTNEQGFSQQFVYLLQVKDESGNVVHISWFQGEVAAHQSLGVSQSWTPENAGTHHVETFVWDSLSEAAPLALPLSAPISVG